MQDRKLSRIQLNLLSQIPELAEIPHSEISRAYWSAFSRAFLRPLSISILLGIGFLGAMIPRLIPFYFPWISLLTFVVLIWCAIQLGNVLNSNIRRILRDDLLRINKPAA